MATAARALIVTRATLAPEDLEIGRRTRDVWRLLKQDAPLMARIARSEIKWKVYRFHSEKDDRSDPLELIGNTLVALRALKASESFGRRVELFVQQLVDDLYAGTPEQSLADLDRADASLEFREDSLQNGRLIDGVASSDEMDAEADALEAEAAANLNRARLLRREARRARAGLVAS